MSLVQLAGRGFHEKLGVEDVRANYAELNRRFGFIRRRGVDVTDLTIPSFDGAELYARFYRPRNVDGALPVMLYFHGGGWVIGDVRSFDHLTRFIAGEGNMAVLSVEYRLGPEHRFPIAFEDGFAALAWLQQHARDLHVDENHIAVGGDSAGAGITASLSTYGADRGLARPVYQFLIYPPVDGTGRFASRTAFTRGLPLTASVVDWFARHYLNRPEDAAAPFMTLVDAPHPERLPQTYILAAGYDPLVDEGRTYAERLRTAGVDVTYDLRPALAHGFVSFPRIAPAGGRAVREAVQSVAKALRR